LLAHRSNAENRRNVDQPDAANFHVMALHLVATANQDIVAPLTGDDEIVGDESMAALDEIENALRFPDATLAGEEQSDAENIGERAMQRDRRRELHLEHRLDAPIELRGFQPGANEWNARVRSHFLETHR